MASGCIIGECPICDESIWEDEDIAFGPNCFYHKRCLSKKKVKIVEVYDIGEVEESLDKLKETLDHCSTEIERLENLIIEMRGRDEI